MPPPTAPDVLTSPYDAKDQRGGTLVVEEVTCLEQHERLLPDPDGYRPGECPCCGGDRLWAHDFRQRHLSRRQRMTVMLRRFRCPSCEAVWLMLPAFIPRHLHGTWEGIQGAVEAAGAVDETAACEPARVSARTVQRWAARLRCCAMVAVQVLADLTPVRWALSQGTARTRGEFVDLRAETGCVPAGRKLAAVAGWLHRVVPGLRLT